MAYIITTITALVLTASFQDNLCKPAAECQTTLSGLRWQQEVVEMVVVITRTLYEGRSISFEPGYLGLYFWAEKCCRPDLLTLISVL